VNSLKIQLQYNIIETVKRLLNIIFVFVIIWFLVETLILFSPVFAIDRNWLGYCILFVFSVIGVLYYHHNGCVAYSEKTEFLGWVREKKERQENMIGDFVNQDFNDMKYWEIDALLEKIKHVKFDKRLKAVYENEFKTKLKEAEKVLKRKEKEGEVNELEAEKYNLKKEIEELEKEKHKKLILDVSRADYIKRRLNIAENHIFRKDKLNKVQIDVLKKEGFESFNAMDILENQMLSVLVNKKIGHSPSHIFLVWSLKRYLKTIKGVSKIEEHLTKDADLTFKYMDKKHAFEVETGTLLGKKKQLDEKVKYMNRKYRKGWIFVVTHRKLLKHYREYGECTQRSRVSEFLEKWLKIDT